MTAGAPRDHASTLAHDHISTIAHDLNNLLTAILGAADTMLAAPALDLVISEEALQIRLAAERAGVLARLMMAHDGATPRPAARHAADPIFGPTTLDEGIDRLAPLLRRVLGGGIGLEVIAAAPQTLVAVAVGGLDRVLLNLITNARNAMPAGGTVTVCTGRSDETAWIAVTDTGTGIPATVLPHIFTSGFTTRADARGAGLGLASVDGIIRGAGGAVTVESVLGQGTTVRLTLPCQAATPSVRTEPVQVPASRVVLLVEDEEPVCRATTRGLRRDGWTVVHAGSAEAALAMVCHRPAPDVVVTDAGLPGMDGLALIAALRARMPSLPAVLVSGYSAPGWPGSGGPESGLPESGLPESRLAESRLAESGWAESSPRRDPAYEGMVVLAKPYEVRALSAAISGVLRPVVRK